MSAVVATAPSPPRSSPLDALLDASLLLAGAPGGALLLAEPAGFRLECVRGLGPSEARAQGPLAAVVMAQGAPVRGDGTVASWVGLPIRPARGGTPGALLLKMSGAGIAPETEERLLALAAAMGTLLATQAHEAQDPGLDILNQSILDSAEFGILSLAPIRDDSGEIIDFRFIAANAANAGITGRPPGHLLQTTLLKEFPGNRDDGLFDRYKAVSATGVPVQFDTRYQHDGVDAFFRISVIRTGADGVTICFVPTTEISRIKEAMRDLGDIATRISSDLQAFSTELLALGARVFDCEYGFFSDVRSGDYEIRNLHGTPEGMARGDRLDIADTLCAACLGDGTPLAFDDVSDDPKAQHPCLPRTRFGAYIGCPIIIDGELYGGVSFCSRQPHQPGFTSGDIELVSLIAAQLAAAIRLERIETDLSESRDELQFIMDHVPSNIWFKDDRNRILRANRSAAAIVGVRDPADLEGAEMAAIFPEIAEFSARTDREILRSGVAMRGYLDQFPRGDGTLGWKQTDKIPLRSHKGQPRILVVSTDVTELKHREAELEAANRQLESFASITAHDLQAPLRQTVMFAEMLRDALATAGLETPAAAQEALEGVVTSTRRMRNMVKALYDLSRVDAGVAEHMRLDLSCVVETAWSQLASLRAETGATLTASGVPVATGSEPLLVQLFQNLLANACMHGGPAPRIRVYGAVRKADGDAEIIVEDDGPGLPADAAEELFQPFKRGGRNQQGLGIGLALCRRIVQVHSGSLEFDQDYSRGARFVVTLPA